MNKAIFLDRDGVINIDKGYVYQWDDFEFVEGILELLKTLQNLGYLLIIITNQSGIARGYYTEKEFQDLTDRMLSYLIGKGIEISNVYYCPHHPDAIIPAYRKLCRCRKPSLGLFEKAIHEYEIDISKSWAIGDSWRDVEICSVYPCNGIIIDNMDSQGTRNADNVYRVNSISQVLSLILNKEKESE